jgi:hypothetical protein
LSLKTGQCFIDATVGTKQLKTPPTLGDGKDLPPQTHLTLSHLESNIRKKLSPAEADNIVLAGSPKTVRHPVARSRTILHNGVMPTADKPVRQSVTLPAAVAVQVRRLAKARRLWANRMLLELIENGMAAERRKQQEFFDLAERFRNAADPAEAERLGDPMGRMVFGS